MAPKKSSSSATPPPPKPVPSHSRALSSTTPSTPSSKPSTSLSNKSSPQDVALHVWSQYLQNTPSRTLLLDAFMAFLVLVGGIQFLYAVIGGNYVSPNRENDILRTTFYENLQLTPPAFQRLPLRFLGRSRPIRPYCLVANADEREAARGRRGPEEDYNEDGRRYHGRGCGRGKRRR